MESQLSVLVFRTFQLIPLGWMQKDTVSISKRSPFSRHKTNHATCFLASVIFREPLFRKSQGTYSLFIILSLIYTCHKYFAHSNIISKKNLIEIFKVERCILNKIIMLCNLRLKSNVRVEFLDKHRI